MRGKAYGRYRPSRDTKRTEQDKHAWLTTYADAVTLLLAFFVLLYTFADIDMERFSELLEGLRVPFGNTAGEGVLDGTHAVLDGIADEPLDAGDRTDLLTELEAYDAERLREILVNLPLESLTLAQLTARAEAQLDVVEQALDEALTSHGLAQHVEHVREERGLVVSISSDDILFALGSTEVGPVGADVIRVVSEVLAGFPNDVQVEGHTDNLPIRRSDYTNWNLSTDRAVAVLSQMIELHELPPDRVGAVGYGEYHPVTTNDTASGRARNRRVDIVVLLQHLEEFQ